MIKYRADIDGLRTLAVVPVLLFHAGAPGFSGGYVGVDIFFVISGFLITSILLKDINQGDYSIATFYARRIRRIFPALTAMVAACAGFGYFVLTPQEYVSLGKSIVAVATFSSNFYYWKSVNYFDNAQAIQPLLHTWSLAVEEQFYIAFPPLLAFIGRRQPKYLTVSLIALAVISFALAAYMAPFKPSAAFYLPLTRAWELLVGSLLAAVSGRIFASLRVRTVAGLMGLALAVMPILFYNSRTVFPGLAALPPVLGASLIIWSGTSGSHPISRFLTLSPVVFVGKISYSLYLWHVPVFAYAIYLTGGPLQVVGTGYAIVISLLLAVASYYLIERPFRKSSRNSAPLIWGSGTAVALALGGAVIVSTGGLPTRLDARGTVLLDAAADKQRFHVECMSVGNVIIPPSRPCILGARNVAPTALLWGDSHAMVTATPMEVEARRMKKAFLFVATADCPPGIGFGIDDATQTNITRMPSYRYCKRYNREMLKLAISSPGIHNIVISARWTGWRIGERGNPAESPVDIRLREPGQVARSSAANAAIYERGLRRLVGLLTKAGKQIYIVGPVPEPVFNVPQRLFVEQFGFVDASRPIKMSEYQRRHRRILSVFTRLPDNGSVRFIWPTMALCRRDVCPIELDGRPNFFDHNHLSISAAKRSAPLYAGVF